MLAQVIDTTLAQKIDNEASLLILSILLLIIPIIWFLVRAGYKITENQITAFREEAKEQRQYDEKRLDRLLGAFSESSKDMRTSLVNAQESIEKSTTRVISDIDAKDVMAKERYSNQLIQLEGIKTMLNENGTQLQKVLDEVKGMSEVITTIENQQTEYHNMQLVVLQEIKQVLSDLGNKVQDKLDATQPIQTSA